MESRIRTAGQGGGKWRTIRLVAGAVLSLGLLWVTVHALAWREVLDAFLSLPPDLLALSLGSFAVSILLRAYRWWVLFVQERVTFLRLFLVQNTGIGVNNLSPLRVVSEPLQLLLLTRRGEVHAATALATLALEHIMDVLAAASLMGLGVLLLPELQGFSLQVAGAVVLAAVSMLVLVLFARGLGAIPIARRVGFFRRLARALATLQRRPLRLVISGICTVGHWSFLGLSGWFLARGLGIPAHLGIMVVLFLTTVFVVSAVPSLPGGVGTFEAAVVYTLSFFDVGGSTAFTFAILMHVIMFVPSTVIALVMIPREGMTWGRVLGREQPVDVETHPDPSP